LNNQRNKNTDSDMPRWKLWLKRYVIGFFIGVWFVVTALYHEWGMISLVAYGLMLAFFTTLYMVYESFLNRRAGKK